MSLQILTPGRRSFLRTRMAAQFQTDVYVQAHSTEESDSGESDVYADPVGPVKGWLRQMNNPGLESIVGALAIQGIFRLLLPWDTDIHIGDLAVIGSDSYVVQNTNEEDTNRISMVCYVRRVEAD